MSLLKFSSRSISLLISIFVGMLLVNNAFAKQYLVKFLREDSHFFRISAKAKGTVNGGATNKDTGKIQV